MQIRFFIFHPHDLRASTDLSLLARNLGGAKNENDTSGNVDLFEHTLLVQLR